MEDERSIIGGMFGLAEPVAKLRHIPTFLKEEALLLANARSGLRVLVDALRPPQIWLPSFLCDAVVAAVQHSTSTLRFYEVAEDLNISTNRWLEQVGERDLLILIDYFGFPSSAECVHHAKARGAWVLGDACQALLSAGWDAPVDFVIYSPRKFLGVLRSDPSWLTELKQ